MKFTFDFKNATPDFNTGNIFVPILTDVSLDWSWYSRVSGDILTYNERHPEDKCLVQSLGLNSIGINPIHLLIEPSCYDRITIDQDFFDNQKEMLVNISHEATLNFLNRKAEDAKVAAVAFKVSKDIPVIIRNLKNLNG